MQKKKKLFNVKNLWKYFYGDLGDFFSTSHNHGGDPDTV